MPHCPSPVRADVRRNQSSTRASSAGRQCLGGKDPGGFETAQGNSDDQRPEQTLVHGRLDSKGRFDRFMSAGTAEMRAIAEPPTKWLRFKGLVSFDRLNDGHFAGVG